MMRFSELKPFFQFAFTIFGRDFLEGDTDVGARFLTACLEGGRQFLLGKTPRFLKQLCEEQGLDYATAVKACRNTFPADGTIDARSVRELLEWQHRRGYLSQQVAPDLLCDNRFLVRAQELIRSDSWRLKLNRATRPEDAIPG